MTAVVCHPAFERRAAALKSELIETHMRLFRIAQRLDALECPIDLVPVGKAFRVLSAAVADLEESF